MMGTLFPLIIMGVFLYLAFFRRGGMGCCGGRSDRDTKDFPAGKGPDNKILGEVITLREDQYTILSSEDDKTR
ncbi:MAG: hypothetical protein ABII06_14055 [Pseudomonadota bacterium]